MKTIFKFFYLVFPLIDYVEASVKNQINGIIQRRYFHSINIQTKPPVNAGMEKGDFAFDLIIEVYI